LFPTQQRNFAYPAGNHALTSPHLSQPDHTGTKAADSSGAARLYLLPVLLFGYFVIGRLISCLRAGGSGRSSSQRYGLCIYMFMFIGFIALGALLGTFLSFPFFALAALACSVLYSFYDFDGTALRYAADLLVAILASQIGYFFTIMVMILRRRTQLTRRDGR